MAQTVLVPNVKFRHKLFLVTIFAGVLAMLAGTALGFVIGYSNGGAQGAIVAIAASVLLNLLWIVPVLLIIPGYYRSLQYEILDDEIIVRVGVVTKSVKHVPYRTVTNLKITRGPFDRLFGIGSLDIQTAGMSGQSGVEERLVGLVDYQEAYERVAQTLRQFRGAMPPTQAGEEPASDAEPVLGAILQEVQAIRLTLAQRSGDQ